MWTSAHHPLNTYSDLFPLLTSLSSPVPHATYAYRHLYYMSYTPGSQIQNEHVLVPFMDSEFWNWKQTQSSMSQGHHNNLT
jgi:hypothetical protein